MTPTLHLVCPHCETVNRMPPVRLADQPKCGLCKRPLFDAQPMELSDATFGRHVQQNGIPVLVDFWAPWCGPCRMMAPAYAEAAKLLEPRVRLAKVNTEESPSAAAQYGIRSIPTMVLFRNGREVARRSGATTARDIIRWVESEVTGG
jgi:thioredoxin 2